MTSGDHNADTTRRDDAFNAELAGNYLPGL
jgi:hypothetical protein